MKLTGATRLFGIVGDPIAQVKSPAVLTRMFAERGVDAVLVPLHVAADDFDQFMDGVKRLRNLDGLVFTVPHKFAGYRHADDASPGARFLESINVLRRDRTTGRWHGDMFDGAGLTGALADAGWEAAGKRALLVGAGGAVSAVALALVEAGVAALAIHDVDAGRRDRLVAGLSARSSTTISLGDTDPTGFDLVVNVTPLGMRPDDPLPVDVEKLTSGTAVADAVTAPPVTALVQAARDRGCLTVTGVAMHAAQTGMLVDFLLG
ncbi:MAG: shikimate dehydrogenase [Rhodospirillaceae bacterium]|nr:shikimate dehydrogenase [Rhodospirillaceae bacterium]